MITPLEYKAEYGRIPVHQDGGNPIRVKVGNYLSGDPTAGKDPLWGKIKQAIKKEKSLTVTVHTACGKQAITFNHQDEMIPYFTRPFYGKGGPEDCQIVLQLALRLGATTVSNLQTYCEDNLGLDCNGFVGNYLWRGMNGNAWYKNPGTVGEGPSSLINYLVKPPFLKSMDDLKPSGMYVLGLVDKDGKVIPGGGHGTGHIMVTNLGGYALNPLQELCYEMFPENPKMNLHPTMRVVESTGGMGLVDSWYAFLSVKDKIFTVYRGCKKARMRVKIRQVF